MANKIRNRAFTLIELLVVISIIALLVSILMPALNKAKESSRIIVCSSRQRSIMQAVHIYMADFNDKLPTSIQGQADAAAPTVSTYWTIPNRLKYYYNTPSALNGGSVIDMFGKYMSDPINWSCPLSAGDSEWQKKYYNQLKDERVFMMDSSYLILWNYMGWKSSTGFNPVLGKHTLMLTDVFLRADSYNKDNGDHISAHPFKGAAKRDFLNAYDLQDTSGGILATKYYMGFVSEMPDIRLNSAYLDGHVETLLTGETYCNLSELGGSGLFYLPDKSYWKR